MSDERLLRIIARLATADAVPPMRRFCEVGAEVSGTTGGGIMLVVDDVEHGWLGASDEVSARIEDLQATLGEGPCLDAYRGGHPVLEPDLGTRGASRWPAFTPPAVAAGACAIFGFPLMVADVRLGALNLYRDATGPLTEDEHANASMTADIAARTVLDLQSQAPGDALAAELAAGTHHRLTVHQAAGMVSVQLDLSIGDAMLRLQARAFADGRTLTEVARDVTARRLRFDDQKPDS